MERKDWADRYVKGQLNEAEMERFEAQYFEDEQLREEVELSLAMVEGLTPGTLDYGEIGHSTSLSTAKGLPALRIAAAIVLAVAVAFTVTSRIQVNRLQDELLVVREAIQNPEYIRIATSRSSELQTHQIRLDQAPRLLVLDVPLPVFYGEAQTPEISLQRESMPEDIINLGPGTLIGEDYLRLQVPNGDLSIGTYLLNVQDLKTPENPPVGIMKIAFQ